MRVQFTLIAVSLFWSIVTAAPSMRDYNKKVTNPKDEFENIDLASFPTLTPEGVEIYNTETEGQAEIKATLEKLQNFHHDMREYVSMAGLDYQDFQPKMEEMKNQLSEIFSTIQSEETKNMLAEDLEFVKRMFENLSTAAEILGKYDNYSVRGAELICVVTNAHVAALGLNNMHGQLDKQIADLEDKVSYFDYWLPLWEEKFSQIKEVYPVEREVFEDQLFEAQEAIGELEMVVQLWEKESFFDF